MADLGTLVHFSSLLTHHSLPPPSPTIPTPPHYSVDTVIECYKKDVDVIEYSDFECVKENPYGNEYRINRSEVRHYDCYLPDTVIDTTWVFPVEAAK